MRGFWELMPVRTLLSSVGMAILLIVGTSMILSSVIDQVALRHSAAIAVRTIGPALSSADSVLTEQRALGRDFTPAFFEMIFMLACSFGAPGLVLLWRGWQKRRSDERIAFLLQHDTATGLLNRACFMTALDEALPLAALAGQMTAVHIVDIDRFKAINDTLGAGTADGLIADVAGRLQTVCGPADLLGRFAGDAFVLAQGGLCSMEEAVAKSLAIRDAFAEPFTLAGEARRVSASIGVAVAPQAGTDAEALMQAADTAMGQAKADGRNTLRLYEPGMDAALQRRRALEDAIQHATETGGFALAFQPVFRAETERLIGFEALLRLPVEGGQPIPPADFIPVAEEMGIIGRIGAWVIEEACLIAATWPDDLIVAVNLSPRQIESETICAVVERALAISGLPAQRLELELTESVLLQDTAEVIQTLGRLKALGVSIAMDDFGTGYSSLSNLWRFPFDKLKIDRSFMSDIAEGDVSKTNILRTIVSLGRSLHLQVTAEGIETQAQADILKAMRCDQLQGYHYGRPADARDVPAIIEANEFGQLGRSGRPGYTYKGRFADFALA